MPIALPPGVAVGSPPAAVRQAPVHLASPRGFHGPPPAPPEPVAVVFDPTLTDALGATDGHTIWLRPDRLALRSVYRHELGHCFDVQVLTAADHRALEEILGVFGPWWGAEGEQNTSPSEHFADTYELLIKTRRIDPTWGYTVGGPGLTAGTAILEVSRYLDALAERPAGRPSVQTKASRENRQRSRPARDKLHPQSFRLALSA